VSLTAETKILSYDSSLKTIFGITGTETTWGDIRQQFEVSSGRYQLWLSEIEKATEQVSLDRDPDQPTGLCTASDGKFYRVLFARYEPYKSRARMCYIAFVPRRPRAFDVRQRTSTLLSTLILAIRFRQRILPSVARINAVSGNKRLNEITKFERELREVETEADEFGLVHHDDLDDEVPLLRDMREGEAKVFVADCIQSWVKARSRIAALTERLYFSGPESVSAESLTEASNVIIEELGKVNLVNGRFIEIITEELLFVEKVERSKSVAVT
jgi:hypothetical protein